MGDVLEQEPRRPTPRWAGPLAIAVLLLGGGYALTHQGDDPPGAGPAGQRPSASERPTSSGDEPVTGGVPWPTVEGACSNTVSLPLLSVAPLTESTGLTALVAGDGLRVVDVDTGRTRRLPGAEHAVAWQVTSLTAGAEGVTALRRRCDGTIETASGVVLDVDPREAARRGPVRVRLDTLIAAPDRSWGHRYVFDPREPVVLRPADGGDPVRLPVGFYPNAATRSDFIGILDTQDSETFQQPPVLAAVSRSTGDVRRVTRGYLLAASDDALVTQGSCDPAQRCVLTRTARDESTRRFLLPRGRVPTSAGTLSADGQRVAFLLSRPEPDPRYLLGHPGGPSDIAVQDLTSGELQIVPGVEMAPKSGVGLTFSADSRWLLVALNEGTRARLLVWRDGLTRPQESPAALPGPLLYDVPVLDVTRRMGLR